MKKKIQKPVKFTLNKITIARLNANTASRLYGGRNEVGISTVTYCESAGNTQCNTGTNQSY